ncbi:MAG: hypothetical protein R3Y50_08055 [Rikenellaceae bacterium]
MEIPPINTRIRQLIDFYANKSVNNFAKTIGIPQQTINRLFNIDKRTQKYPVATTDIIIAITQMYVDVNPGWLLTGTGNMINKDTPKGNVANIKGGTNKFKQEISTSIPSVTHDTDMLLGIIAQQREQISKYQEQISAYQGQVSQLINKLLEK